MAHPRLDEWLLSCGYYATRARARDAILRGCVIIDNENSVKPSRRVTDPSLIRVEDPAARFVSRAAMKLKRALDETGISPKNKIALDLGASTGGFCQVLLEAGAEHVYAVDVGHNQMDPRILSNRRLTNIEGVNARELSLSHLEGMRPEFITSDVSFISLKLALPPALNLAQAGAIGIFLVKPQFEVGKDALGKGGIVRDKKLAEQVAVSIRDWLSDFKGWTVDRLMESPITGGDGNSEYLLIGKKHEHFAH